MGAYYYDQILHPFPPIADFTVDVTSGYLPLTVNLTDLSTQGSGIIDEWYWDFGDGNNSTLHNPAHEYLLPGIHTISLTVTDVNDSTDTETKIDYITVYSTDPPAPPTDVQVNISGEDAIIIWTAVDTTIYGDPTIIDGYVVYFNEMPDDEHFWFLAFTANTVHTHEFVAQFSEQMFYNVVAYVDLGEDELNYLKEMNNSTRKVSKLEVRKELSRMRKR
jgi:PKD repeat protein